MNLLPIPLVLIAGWLFGSLINYLNDSLMQTRRIKQSKCLECGHPLNWRNYILMQPCAGCCANPDLRYWLVQILVTLMTLGLWVFPPPSLNFWIAIPVFLYFALVMTMDIAYRIVMHPVSIAGAIIGLLLGIYMNGIPRTLLGGAIGFGIMFGLYYLGGLFTRIMSRIRKQEIEEVALGYGDVNISGVLGLMVGFPQIVTGLMIAIIVAGVFSALFILGMLLLKRYQAFSAIPYAPFLVLMAGVLIYLA